MPMAREGSMLVSLATFVLVAACGDDGGGTDGAADATPDGGDGGPGATVEAPMPPAPPVLGPCEGGWQAAVTDAVDFCDPYPAGMSACSDAEAHFPGGAGCERVGAACPSGDFPDDVLDDSSAAFVLAGASAGGDGSRAAPLRTLAEAVATGRTTIVVGPGTYDEEANLPPGTTLRGACAARTVLTNTVADRNRPVVNPMGPGVVVRDLRIADAARAGVRADAAGAIELVGVVVDRASRIGIAATNGGSVTVRDSIVRRTRYAGDEFAEGVFGIGNATLVLDRVVVADDEHSGLVSSGMGSTLTLTDVAVSGHQGPGVFVQLGATADITRLVVQDGGEYGLLVGGMGASATVSSSLIRDISASTSGMFGFGLTARDVSTLTVRKTAVLRSTGVGLAAEASTVDVEDLVVIDVAPLPDGTAGRGLSIQPGTVLSLARVHVERAHESGVLIGGVDSVTTVADVLVRDTQPAMAGAPRARGFHVQLSSAPVEADRVRVEGGYEAGVIVAGATLNVRDLAVFDVASNEPDGDYGRGIEVGLGGVLDATRMRVEDSADLSVSATGSGSRVMATQVALLSTATSTIGGGGHGVGAYGGGAVAFDGFVIDQAAVCGVQVADDGALDLANGQVSNAEIGACVQIEGYDVDRLTTRVQYVDNTTNLDATSLPVPEPIPSITE